MKLISSALLNSPPHEKQKSLPAQEQEHAAERKDELKNELNFFEIGELDDDDDDDEDDELETVEENHEVERNEPISIQQPPKPLSSKMQDPTYEINNDFEPTPYHPEYEPILATDDDEDAPRRNMLGYAAYHGPRWIPAEIKDNIEHWRSNRVTKAPSLCVARPPNLFSNWGS